MDTKGVATPKKTKQREKETTGRTKLQKFYVKVNEIDTEFGKRYRRKPGYGELPWMGMTQEGQTGQVGVPLAKRPTRIIMYTHIVPTLVHALIFLFPVTVPVTVAVAVTSISLQSAITLVGRE